LSLSLSFASSVMISSSRSVASWWRTRAAASAGAGVTASRMALAWVAVRNRLAPPGTSSSSNLCNWLIVWVLARASSSRRSTSSRNATSSRYRQRHSVSGAKGDPGDAHVLADMVRTDRHQLRPVAGDSAEAEAVKVLSRAHKTLIWERTRHLLRLRHALREFFPAALVAFDDLTGVDALELLAAAPQPTAAAALSLDTITAALKQARRRNRAAKAETIAAALRAEHLAQPPVVAAAYAVTVRAQVAILSVLNTQIAEMEQQVEANFSQHPDAEVYRSQPGLGTILGARVLAEFDDDKQALRRRPGPPQLRRHQPDHPTVRQEEARHGPLRAQRPPPRHPRPASLLRAARLTRRPRLLRPHPRPRHRPPRSTTTTAWSASCTAASNAHHLRRSQRLGTNPTRSTTCRLTKFNMGCLLIKGRTSAC
jgi:hypothetical protein